VQGIFFLTIPFGLLLQPSLLRYPFVEHPSRQRILHRRRCGLRRLPHPPINTAKDLADSNCRDGTKTASTW
jgi:hypothetical protein